MSPSHIESTVRDACPLAGLVVAIADHRPFVSLLVVLDPDAAAVFAAQHGLQSDIAALAAHSSLQDAMQQGIDVANSKLSRAEQVRAFTVVPEYWQPGSDVLTPTMKVRRKSVNDRYAAQIAAMYTAGTDGRVTALHSRMSTGGEGMRVAAKENHSRGGRRVRLLLARRRGPRGRVAGGASSSPTCSPIGSGGRPSTRSTPRSGRRPERWACCAARSPRSTAAVVGPSRTTSRCWRRSRSWVSCPSATPCTAASSRTTSSPTAPRSSGTGGCRAWPPAN